MKTLSALLVLFATAWFVPPAVAQSNTLVRFHFYRGTTVIGDVDVEMFDYDKPVTVSNFLRYVRSGAYHNLLLNRVVPGFAIQAGALWTPTPLSSAPFEAFFTPNFGQITNEFGVGPRLSNTFGTIAMARYSGETNSASSEFFFNLGNNSTNLDNVDGGFTVFGRMIPGTNALDFFDHTSPKLNILNFGGYFADFPVSNTNHNCGPVTGCPRYNELYHIRISVLPITGTKPPTVRITSPAQNAKITNSPLLVTGTATDDHGISSVFYSVGGIPFTNAPAGTQWSFNTVVPAGTNYLYLASVDTSGQRSSPVSRTFFYSVLEPLRLTNIGNGIVVGLTNGQLLEIGRNYTVTAKPAPGHLFADWNGFAYEPARITFTMRTNLALTATFVPNPFPQLKGTWSGLFANADFATQPGGAITFSVTELGKVTGKLNVAGRNLPFSGGLTAYGEAYFFVSAASVAGLFGARPNWFVRFTLDTTNKTDQVFGPNDGEIGGSGTGFPYVWEPTGDLGQRFTSRLSVNKVRPGTLANPSAYFGKHTLAIAGGTTIAQPFGMSYGAVTVNAAGTASFAGSLADGTPFTQSAAVSTNGQWPFYSGLYGGRGWMSGWVGFDFNNLTNDLQGSMRWRKTGPLAGRPYPNSFEIFPGLTGSRYTNATATVRVLTNLTDGVLALTGPNLIGAALTNYVFLNTNNTVVNRPPSTNKLTFTLTKPSGIFTGTVKPVGENRTLAYKGVMLPKQGYGVGYYLSTNLSGRVYLGP